MIFFSDTHISVTIMFFNNIVNNMVVKKEKKEKKRIFKFKKHENGSRQTRGSRFRGNGIPNLDSCSETISLDCEYFKTSA